MVVAVIFDFDGVVADTEPLHHKAFEHVLADFGLSYSWADYQDHFIGFDDRDGFREMFARAGRDFPEDRLKELVDRKAAAFARLAETEGAEPYPGVVDSIRALAADLPVGLCSGALRSDVDPILGRLQLDTVFRVMVTAEEVTKSKPDPESYTLAVRRMGRELGRELAPGECVAVEDTPTGVESARTAGLRVLAVTNTHHTGDLSRADHVVASLKDMNAAALQEWFG